MLNQKFNIGQRVTSKKTGLPTIGIIKGVADAAWHLKGSPNFDSVISANNAWQSKYPDYLDKPIYYVEFVTPQRHVSFQEFVNGMTYNYQHHPNAKQFLDERLLMVEYSKIPITTQAVYPEDDLEEMQ